MSQIKNIIDALKREMKAKDIKYRDIATHLSMGETSVRRLFSQENISLQRLASICELLGMEISDLIFNMEANRKHLFQLSVENEQKLSQDPFLILMAHLVINGWSFEDIMKRYDLPETKIVSYLIKLDRMGLMELLPNNRIKLCIAEGFSWRENGHVLEFFRARLEKDFFSSQFKEDTEGLFLMTGMMTDESIKILREKLFEIKKSFMDLNRQERSLPIETRKHVGIVAAIRPILFSVYDDIRRQDAYKTR